MFSRIFLSVIIIGATLLVACNLFDSNSDYGSDSATIGDINSNGVSYEVADWVLFQNYLVEGESALPEGTALGLGDINFDGQPLTLADLVCFRRIFDGDAKPRQRFPSEPVEVRYEAASILYVTDPLGALLLVLEGTIAVEAIPDYVDMRYRQRDGKTYVLVTPEFGGTVNDMTGQLVYLSDAKILKIEMATPNGAPVTPRSIFPVTFVLYENYPNPFSGSTTISFDLAKSALWKLEIYDVEAVIVDQINGYSEAGHVEIIWTPDHDIPAGVYFYRLTIGDETYTRAMFYNGPGD